MSFKLVISDTVVVAVKGQLPTASGSLQQFNFSVVCKRLNAEELRDALAQNDRTVNDFVQSVATGWSGVLDESDQPLPFNDAALASL